MALEINETFYHVIIALVGILGIVLGLIIVLSQTIWWYRTYSYHNGNTFDVNHVTHSLYNCTNDYPECRNCVTVTPAILMFVQMHPNPVVIVTVAPDGYMHISTGSTIQNVAFPFDIDSGVFDTFIPGNGRISGKVDLEEQTLYITSLGYPSTFVFMSFADPSSLLYKSGINPVAIYDCCIGTETPAQQIRPEWNDMIERCINPSSKLGSPGELLAMTSSTNRGGVPVCVAINLKTRKVLLYIAAVGIPNVLEIDDCLEAHASSKVIMVGVIKEDWCFSMKACTQRCGDPPLAPPSVVSGWVDFQGGAIHLEHEDGHRISLILAVPETAIDILQAWNER
jgi:hypothetical protein